MKELTLTIKITIDDKGWLEAGTCHPCRLPLPKHWRKDHEPSDDELRALACIAMLPLADKFVGHHLPGRVSKDLERLEQGLRVWERSELGLDE